MVNLDPINPDNPGPPQTAIERFKEKLPNGIKIGREAIHLAGIQHELTAHLTLQSDLGFLAILRAGAPPNLDRRFIASKPSYIKIKTSKGQGFFNGFLTANLLFQRLTTASKPPTALVDDMTDPSYLHQTQLTINIHDLVRQVIRTSGDLEIDNYNSLTKELSFKFKPGKGHPSFNQEGRFIIQLESELADIRSSASTSFTQSSSSAQSVSSATSSFTRPDYITPEGEIVALISLLGSQGVNQAQIEDKEFKLSYRENPDAELKPALVLAKTPRDVAELKKALLAIKIGQQRGAIPDAADQLGATLNTTELDIIQATDTRVVDSDSDAEIVIADATLDRDHELAYDCEIIPIQETLIPEDQIDRILGFLEQRGQEETAFADVLKFIGKETLSKMYGIPNIARMITSDWDGLALLVPQSLAEKPEFLEPLNAFDPEQIDKLKKLARSYLKYLIADSKEKNPNLYKVISDLNLEDLEQHVPTERFGIVTPVELIFNMLTNYCYKLSSNLAYGEDYQEKSHWQKVVKKALEAGVPNLKFYHQHLLYLSNENYSVSSGLKGFIQQSIMAGALDLTTYYNYLVRTDSSSSKVQELDKLMQGTDIKEIDANLQHLHDVNTYLKDEKVHHYIDEWLRLSIINKGIIVMHHIDYDHNTDRIFEHGYEINSPYEPEIGAWFLIYNGLPVYGDSQAQLFEFLLMDDGAILKENLITVSPKLVEASHEGELGWAEIVAKQLELGQNVRPDTRDAYIKHKQKEKRNVVQKIVGWVRGIFDKQDQSVSTNDVQPFKPTKP